MSGPLVMKFGGSSLADAERFNGVAALVRERSSEGVLVVVSAMAKVTDGLFACAREASRGDEATALAGLDALIARHREVAVELLGPKLPPFVEASLASALSELSMLLRGAALLGELPPKSLDILAGRGELLSSTILAARMGVSWIDARKVLRTDSHFGAARPLTVDIKALAEEIIVPVLRPGMIAVTQGYIGADASGTQTTLGRGGSDYSASLLGAAINATEIQIWTDVEGVLTSDPQIVPSARPVEILGYDEAAELAAFGAKILHPATILPAAELGIPVTVRNSLLPGGRFTTISREGASGQGVTALASRGPVTVITVRTPGMLGGAGFLSRIFEVFGKRGVSVDIVSTSEVGVSLTVEAAAPVAELEKELSTFAEVLIARDRAIVALVGQQLRRTAGIPGRAFGALCDLNVEMISLGANEINLSLVVAKDDAPTALRLLHAAFFEGASSAGCGDGGHK